MRLLAAVFVASIFLSAFLLFMVQPLVARLLLPVFGGSPAVWNTALVFFQSLLLAGYLYAHALTRLRTAAAVLAVHASVLVLPLLFLPPGLPSWLGRGPPPTAWPLATLLGALAAVVAVPFFALSSNASLIQWWWSRSGFRVSHDPYWLYGASNAGSLLALLAYPFLLEPALGVSGQAAGWSVAYGAFVVLTLLALARGVRGPTDPVTPAAPAADSPRAASHGIDHTDRGLKPNRSAIRWVVRSAVGSSLLLSVTTQITTDLAPVPLLWVVPLSLYLVTFVLAFGLADRLPRPPLVAGVLVALTASVGLELGAGAPPFESVLGVSLGTLFLGALLCHRDLVAERPPTRDLTAYYLWIAVGGALGGVLNSLLAPVVFDSVAELPLTLMALAALVHVLPGRRGLAPVRPGWRVALVAGLALVWPLAVSLPAGTARWIPAAMLALGAAWGLAATRYVGLVGVTVWLAGALVLVDAAGPGNVLEQERSFFGVISVRDVGPAIEMLHGTTLHGRQWKDSRRRGIPAPYYHPAGPLGSLVAGATDVARVGVVGLGTGGLAATARAGQRVTFFEIDPTVERLARAHFTYLADSQAAVEVVLGDGRLELAATPDHAFDVLIVDAFSSDFVPVHLLTREAMDLYLRKVDPEGILALHISNRHADLRRVMRGYAEATGRPVLFADFVPTADQSDEGASRTLAVALSPSPERLEALAASALWTRFGADVDPVRWTDDHADLLSVLR